MDSLGPNIKESEHEIKNGAINISAAESGSNPIERNQSVPDNYILIPGIEDLEYDQVLESFGSRLYVVANTQLQNSQLFRKVPPGPLLSNNTIAVLKAILQSRHNGISQGNLVNLLEIEPRAAGQYLRVLEQKGAIVRKISSSTGLKVNLYIHIRFNKPETPNKKDALGQSDTGSSHNKNTLGTTYSYKTLLPKIVDLLEKTPDNAMSISNIFTSLDLCPKDQDAQKRLSHALNTFCLRGYLQKINSREFLQGESGQCFRLVKTQNGEQEHSIKVPGIKEKTCPTTTRLLRDVTLEHQILMALRKSGTKGITQKDIAKEIGCENPSPFTRIMDKLVNLDGIGKELYAAYRHLESKGRNRQYRYYTYNAYKQVIEGMDVEDIENDFHVPFPFTDEDMVEFDYLSLRSNRNTGLSTEDSSLQNNPKNDTFKDHSPHPLQPEPRKGVDRPKRVTRQIHPTRGTLTTLTSRSPIKRTVDEYSEKDTENNTKAKNQNTRAKRTKTNIEPKEISTILTRRITRNSRPELNTDLQSTSYHETPGTKASNVVVASSSVPIAVCDSDNDVVMNHSDLDSVIHSRHQEQSSPFQSSSQENIRSIQHDHSTLKQNDPITISDEASFLATGNESPAANLVEPTVAMRSEEKAPCSIPNAQNSLESEQSTTHSHLNIVSQTANSVPISNKANLAKGTRNKLKTTHSQGESLVETPQPRMTRSRKTAQPEKAGKPVSSASRSSKRQPPETGKISDFFSKAALKKAPKASSKVSIDPIIEPKPTNEPVLEISEEVSSPARQTPEIPQESIADNQSISTKEIEMGKSTEPLPANECDSQLSPEASNDSFPKRKLPTRKRPISTDDSPYNSDSETPEDSTCNLSTMDQASSSLEPPKKKGRPKIPEHENMLTKNAKRPSKQVNFYLEQRKKVFMALLEESPIYERGYNFRNLYSLKFKEIYGNSKTNENVCLKTIWRTAQALRKEGLVDTHEISTKLLSGSVSKRALFFRKGLKIDGPELKAYIATWTKNQYLYTSRGSMQKYEEIKNPVERLSERLGRMEKDLEKAKEVNPSDVDSIEKKITDMKANIITSNAEEKTTQGTNRTSFGNWMIIGMQFGYIPAKNIRCKELHHFLLDLFHKDVPEINQQQRCIPTLTIINEMPLSLFFKIIGLFHPDDEIREYIKNPENRNTKLPDLPHSIGSVVFNQKGKLRNRLYPLLEVLEWLSLIKRVPLKETDVVPLGFGPQEDDIYYNVLVDVTMFDPKDPERIAIHKYEIHDPKDIHIYWSDLQYICNISEDERAKIHSMDVSESERRRLSSLFSVKNWSTTFMFTAAQRAILNSHINHATGKTPLRRSAICKEIAREINLTQRVVQGYFKKLEEAFRRRKEKQYLRVLERESGVIKHKKKRRSRGYRKVDLITLGTTHPFKKRVYSTAAKRLARDVAKANRSNSSLDSDIQSLKSFHDTLEEVPILAEADLSKDKKKIGFTRKSWSADEDDLLIYSYIVLKNRSEQDRMRWSLVVDLFPNRNINKLRRRMGKLLQFPKVQRRTSYLKKHWRILYNEAIKSGELKELPEDSSRATFSISDELIYFLEKIKDLPKDDSIQLVNLPENPVEGVDFVMSEKPMRDDVFFDDAYHKFTTRKARQEHICSVTLTGRFSDVKNKDDVSSEHTKEVDISQRQLMFLKTFFRMVLFTPEERFDTFYTYAIISHIPRELVGLAGAEQRHNGVMRVSKTTWPRKVPGTSFSISDRFMRRMAGTMPAGYYKQAREYEKYISENKHLTFTPTTVSSGMMACLINYFSEGKIEFSIKNFEELSKRPTLFHRRSRTFDESLTEFDINIKSNVSSHEYEDVPPHVEHNSKARLLSPAEFKFAYNSLKFTKSYLHILITKIVDVLSLAKCKGLSIFEIKTCLELPQGISDSDIFKAITILSENNPPLIARVGFEASRVVLTMYLENWLVLPRNAIRIRDTITDDIQADIHKVSKKDVVNLRIWNDIKGERTESVWNGCIAAVTNLILERPGITEYDIERYFCHLLIRTEIQDLLTTLVNQKILRKLVMSSSTPKPRLFGKSLILTTTDPESIQPLKRTCYWTIRGYHRKIPI
ncbi:hypothetical protein CLU79DRAFT_837736 [Phycomyces nitens]|nr:hypothetical protein CLU79DRAFT_837736 [Phycomyces nitens]